MDIVIRVILAIGLIFAVVKVNQWSNSKQQIACEAKGGIFSKSVEPSHSLCQMPSK